MEAIRPSTCGVKFGNLILEVIDSSHSVFNLQATNVRTMMESYEISGGGELSCNFSNFPISKQ